MCCCKSFIFEMYESFGSRVSKTHLIRSFPHTLKNKNVVSTCRNFVKHRLPVLKLTHTVHLLCYMCCCRFKHLSGQQNHALQQNTILDKHRAIWAIFTVKKINLRAYVLPSRTINFEQLPFLLCLQGVGYRLILMLGEIVIPSLQ